MGRKALADNICVNWRQLIVAIIIVVFQKNNNMHTILGANGIIGTCVASTLRAQYEGDLKLVGRNPEKIHEDDHTFKADLLDPEQVKKALKDTEIAYLTVGLPYDTETWLRDWVIVLKNVIAGCREIGCKLAYFDNTYAYPQDVSEQKEDTPMTSEGKKGIAKKMAAEVLLEAMNSQEVEAVICRAPEFYGPGKTTSFTNGMIFGNLKKGRKAQVYLSDETLRTLIYTPDAGASMALLAHTPDAYGQTWHLPCDDNRLTYKAFIREISNQLGREIDYEVLDDDRLAVLSEKSKGIRETQELFPRYRIDNIFDSSKFKSRFPDFRVTTYQEGIKAILEDWEIQ